jgi:hypothetical protein
MSSEHQAIPQNTQNPPATVGAAFWVAIVLTVIAVGFYVALRQMLLRLPSSRGDIDQLRTNAPALTRLMIVGAAGALLNLASLVLSLFSYISSQRHRTLAAILLFVSGSMLLVLFSIIFTSLIIG